MTKKKNNKTWTIIIIIVGLLLFVQLGGAKNMSNDFQKIIDNIKNIISGNGIGSFNRNSNLGNPEKDFMSVRLYDEDGNQIIVPDTFSMVNGIPGVASLDYTVTITNEGGVPLTCMLVSILPPDPFDCASCSTTGGPAINLDETIQVLSGAKGSWTSNRLYTGPPGIMETISPITLHADVTCYYYEGQERSPFINANGEIVLRVESVAGTAGYRVDVDVGGIGTDFCGDDTCQSPLENTLNCIADCVITPNVLFRTTHLSYLSGSAIGYTDTCGNTLNQYGYLSFKCNSATDLNCPALSEYTLRMSNIPGYPDWSGSSSNNQGCLYTQNDFSFTDDGLIGYWKLDTDNTNQLDSSDTEKTLTVNTATYTSGGKINGAYNFPNAGYIGGISNYPLFDSTTSFTFLAWIYPNFYETGYGRGVMGRGYNYAIDIRPDNYVRFGVRVYGQTTSALSLINVPTLYNNWHHVAGVYDATAKTVTVYADGVPGTVVDASLVNFITGSNTFNIARNGVINGNGRSYSGVIDEAMIYDRALSQAEINQIMSATSNQRTISSTNPNSIILSWKQPSSTLGPCTSGNQWGIIKYNYKSSYASSVSNDAFSFDSAKEVSC